MEFDHTEKNGFDHTGKPLDMAEDAVLSADGVNPVAKDEENPEAKNGYEDGLDIAFPGMIPPAYFPGFPGGPSIG